MFVTLLWGFKSLRPYPPHARRLQSRFRAGAIIKSVDINLCTRESEDMTDSKQLPALQFDSKGCAVPETVAERLVLEQVKTGEFAYILGNRDVEKPATWTNDQTLRADFVRHLCLNPSKYDMDPRGINISGARIRGELNLQYAKLAIPIIIIQSRFEATPDFLYCKLPHLDLTGCSLPGLIGNALNCSGSIILKNIIVNGEVQLTGANIEGQLLCDGAKFICRAVLPSGRMGCNVAISSSRM